MAGCSFERVLQTIRSPLRRTSAFHRLFSTVRIYNQASLATGSRTLPCDTPQLRRHEGGVLGQSHGHLMSLKRSTMIHINSLIRSINTPRPCSYSILRHSWRCIHSTNSESFCWFSMLWPLTVVFAFRFAAWWVWMARSKIPWWSVSHCFQLIFVRYSLCILIDLPLLLQGECCICR